ncbi:MAG: Uma2 family endonuclease [Gemmatimonadota bacterium]|nr:Uma2 family endonuclease [Gemmatimonadota bacterium]
MQTRQQPKTWEDVLRMPDDGNRYEFIGGRLYVTAAPVIRHQRISRRLQAALMRILQDAGRGEVFYAPCLVEFPGTVDRVQPDLFFVAEERREIIAEKQVLGAPDLVVEILSPSTAHRDRGIKLDLYARCGVREYWIVDPVEDVIDVWRFGDGPGHERFSGELPVRLGAERVGRIDLDQVFSRHLDVWERGEP